ncbi:MAG: thiamine diphosphokinase, partial [Bacillus sp. (in: firmicutes)]
MKKIYIMAGGPVDGIPDVSQMETPTVWVGVDKGISTLLSYGVTPQVAFGDFDSIKAEDLITIQNNEMIIFDYPSQKDDTDLALAVEWALGQESDEICIFGSTGGRMDHTMGSVGLLLQERTLQSRTFVSIVDRWNVMYAVLPGIYEIHQNLKFKYISFFTMTPVVKGLTLEGFQYPLQNKTITLGSNLCVSNELISESGHFSFTDGILLVVRSN